MQKTFRMKVARFAIATAMVSTLAVLVPVSASSGAVTCTVSGAVIDGTFNEQTGSGALVRGYQKNIYPVQYQYTDEFGEFSFEVNCSKITSLWSYSNSQCLLNTQTNTHVQPGGATGVELILPESGTCQPE